jgi:hypothetical protein
MKKTCKICGIEKPLEEMVKNKNSKYGRENQCNECRLSIKRNKYNSEVKPLIDAKRKEKEIIKPFLIQKRKEYKQSYMINYRKLNSEKIKKYNFEYKKNKMETDELYKIYVKIRNNIAMSLKNKGVYKKERTHNILGCTILFFKQYIESLWEPWMNWDNHGKYNGDLNYGWDLDHIIPVSSASTEEELIKLNHYTNFKPLCSYTNRYVKKNKKPQ